MPVIYHVTTAEEWQSAKEKGAYTSPSLQTEGFIHCSSNNEQVIGVLQRYFAGRKDLLRLSIDTDKLSSRFVYEWSPSTADTFPHVYGPIDIAAVIEVEKI